MKLRGRFQQLRTQLFVFFMIVTIAVLAASSYIIYAYMLDVIKGQNERNLLQQFQQLDYNIQGLTGDVDRLSKLFLLDTHVQRFLQTAVNKDEIDFVEMKNALHSRIEAYIGNYNYIDSIYIVTNHHGAIGGTETTTLVHSEREWLDQFMTSDAHLLSHQAFPFLHFKGGVTKSYYNPYVDTPNDRTVISMMRAIRPLYEANTTGTLIFNIDERYFASTYSATLDASEGEMYVVDDQGFIVSSNKPEHVGQPSPYIPPSGEEGAYGSIDSGNNDRPAQIVYYRLQDTNWYMMREIPLALYEKQIYSVQRVILLVFLFSLVVMFVINYFWLKRIIAPLNILAHKMKDMSRGELGVTFRDIPNNEFGLVIRRFNEMSLSIVDLLHKNNEIQEKKRELEIEALHYQINPHFLYNTLNMIRWMASIIKADNIVNSIVALGNILRPTFTSKDTMCKLRDELSYLENYIKIINWRFNNSVVFSFEVDEGYLDFKVPRFILQPLVENCITFGGQDEGRGIQIHIEVYEDRNELYLAVIDSGVGIEPARLEALNRQLQDGSKQHTVHSKGNGIGLYNVNKRIQLNFGPLFGLRLVPKDRGAEVVVKLPKIKDEE